MDNFDNNNMGGFEPQKPFTEKPVQNNSMNTEQTIPVSEPETGRTGSECSAAERQHTLR